VGEAYFEQCSDILYRVEQADTLVSQMQGIPRGQLRISCNMAFGQLLLAKALPPFMQNFAQVSVDVTLDDRPLDPVRDGFDLAIRIADPALPDSSLIARRIGDMPLYICATPDYIARHGEPRSAGELAGHNCLVFAHASSPQLWTLNSESEQCQVAVQGDFRANNSLLVREALMQHRGIANLASFVVEEGLESGQLVRLFKDFKPECLGIFAVYPERKYMAPKVAAFIDFFQHWLGEQLPQ